MQGCTNLFRGIDPVSRSIFPRLITLMLSLAVSTASAEETLDSIIVIVDESVITKRDLEDYVTLTKINLRQAGRRLPDEQVLYDQLLESLITESLMLQEAQRRGVRITDSQLNQAMQQLASHQNMSLSADFTERDPILDFLGKLSEGIVTQP